MRAIRTSIGSTRSHMTTPAVCLAAAMTAISATNVAAHLIGWRDGMSRIVGFGHCAKGPCMRRYDFSPSVRHAHVEIDGRHAVVMCTGLGRQHPDCPSPWQGARR